MNRTDNTYQYNPHMPHVFRVWVQAWVLVRVSGERGQGCERGAGGRGLAVFAVDLMTRECSGWVGSRFM